MTAPVNFELAKMLKESGYDELQAVGDQPTIAEVVMWLYEKYGIWIEVRKSYVNGFIPLVKPQRKELNSVNSPTEAYEAAIEYALNNLI